MKKQNPIGFHVQDEKPEQQEQEQTSEHDNLVKALILSIYKTSGDSAEKEFVTGLELIHEFSEAVNTDLRTINRIMDQLGVNMQNIEGSLCYVLYKSVLLE